jgi:uncharacterized damage-inducible protein DinB
MSIMPPAPSHEQALFLRDGHLLPLLKAEHPVTRRVIDAIPADRSDFRHDGIAKSAIDLAWHIVGAEHRFLNAVVTGVFDYANTGRPEPMRTAADVSQWYAETFARDVVNVAAVPADQLVKILDFRGLFQLPAIAFVQIGLNHSIHHRGQLSMYLRPMGAKVPSIYGESYDSVLARQAQA